MHKKCPYLSTQLECFAGSFGTIRCLDHKFHSNCEFKHVADKKGIAVKSEDILEKLIRIDF